VASLGPQVAEQTSMTLAVEPEATGQRLDTFVRAQLNISRARVQELITGNKILVNGVSAKAALKLRGGERITLLGPAERPPLRAVAEAIFLDILYEDEDLAVIHKPAGMMVHGGAGATDDARNRGTLVNALMHHFHALSAFGGETRPGIVHRLDKDTSGLIVVAKNDASHAQLAAQFALRKVKKKYLALVHGWPKSDSGTISSPISRDRVRRTRMSTKGTGGREAVSHYKVTRRLQSSFGKFALLEIKIDTGRTHQIRVHMASLGHPVVGDSLYGAPRELKATRLRGPSSTPPAIALSRNFLHSAELELIHPRTGQPIAFTSPLPAELESLLGSIACSLDNAVSPVKLREKA
jgi:23S rRNA pseudouridine1911/1915/1917 synthase